MKKESEKIKEEEINFLISQSYKEVAEPPLIETIREKYLGKGGIISRLFSQISESKNLEEKKRIGSLLNNWKKTLEEKIAEIENNEKREEEKKDKLDIYLEGKKIPVANLHPITQFVQKIYDIFLRLGYQIIESPEIETDENNFTLLNIPPNHPARGMHDTFYLNNNLLLRTHTSNTQIRLLKSNSNQELRVISAGKVYRRDEDDATHTHQFTQAEGFVVGRNINFSHLKGTIELFLKELLGKERSIRFRPSYFPFTEPSVEVDIQCFSCRGHGCNVCKKTGWIEVLGAGLIHPQVLKNCGFNNQKFTGLAFGLGVERLLMIKYGVEDIRNFYLNDIRFLHQFKDF